VKPNYQLHPPIVPQETSYAGGHNNKGVCAEKARQPLVIATSFKNRNVEALGYNISITLIHYLETGAEFLIEASH
jgi:hypothetical protein